MICRWCATWPRRRSSMPSPSPSSRRTASPAPSPPPPASQPRPSPSPYRSAWKRWGARRRGGEAAPLRFLAAYPPTRLPAYPPTRLPAYVPQVARVLVEDQLRRDALEGDVDEADAEVRLPAAVGGGAGVEEDRPLRLLDLRDVAVAVDDAIHGAGVAARFGTGGFAAVSVQEHERVRPDGEADVLRQGRAQGGLLVVAGDGEHRGDRGQLLQHRGGVDVAGVEDQADADAAEEIRHLRREAVAAAGVDVGVGDDADRERGREGALARRSEAASRRASGRHRSRPGAARGAPQPRRPRSGAAAANGAGRH